MNDDQKREPNYRLHSVRSIDWAATLSVWLSSVSAGLIAFGILFGLNFWRQGRVRAVVAVAIGTPLTVFALNALFASAMRFGNQFLLTTLTQLVALNAVHVLAWKFQAEAIRSHRLAGGSIASRTRSLAIAAAGLVLFAIAIQSLIAFLSTAASVAG